MCSLNNVNVFLLLKAKLWYETALCLAVAHWVKILWQPINGSQKMLQYYFRGLICLFLQLALHNLLHFWTLPYVEYFLKFPFISNVHCTLRKLTSKWVTNTFPLRCYSGFYNLFMYCPYIIFIWWFSSAEDLTLIFWSAKQRWKQCHGGSLKGVCFMGCKCADTTNEKCRPCWWTELGLQLEPSHNYHKSV